MRERKNNDRTPPHGLHKIMMAPVLVVVFVATVGVILQSQAGGGGAVSAVSAVAAVATFQEIIPSKFAPRRVRSTQQVLRRREEHEQQQQQRQCISRLPLLQLSSTQRMRQQQCREWSVGGLLLSTSSRRRSRRRGGNLVSTTTTTSSSSWLAKSNDNSDEVEEKNNNAEFLPSQLQKVESLESMLEELEEYYATTPETSMMMMMMNDGNNDDLGQQHYDEGKDNDDETVVTEEVLWSEKTLLDIFGDLSEEIEEEEEEEEEPDAAMLMIDRRKSNRSSNNNNNNCTTNDDENNNNNTNKNPILLQEATTATTTTATTAASSLSSMERLERALLQGVVPVSANVGSDCLPGDFGFDPLHLATKDYFQATQNFLLALLPETKNKQEEQQEQATPTTTTRTPWEDDDNEKKGWENNKPHRRSRPKALILRDYREAEIRHGRLAMLAAIFWPLQEQLDALLLDTNQAGPLLYGPVTLPYFPLLMTLIMLLLGYMDIYSQSIKDRDAIGDAFLPGDCFWDPLHILEGAPNSMKRNMQERELFNGRVAMIAVVVFLWEEAITHLPLADIEGNELLLKPAYQVPYIQEWLDRQFS